MTTSPIFKKSTVLMTGALAVLWMLSQLYFTFVQALHPMIYSPVFLSFALAIVFVSKPFPGSQKMPWLRVIDFICVAILAGVIYFYFVHAERIVNRIPHIDDVQFMDKVIVVTIIAMLLEASRRVLGWNLTVFVGLFVLYAFAGQWAPGFIRFPGFSLDQFTEIMTLTTEGIYGTPLSATAGFIFYFILFGAFFSACGGGQVLIDIGMRFSKSKTGGPAKAAVISSALMGMISGSAVANVATTGVMTIPMMKKVGFKPEQAGAIESVASTGGQIMPPIMGVGAFIMAELLGVRYGSIALSATIPALAYFISVLLLVGFIARRNAHENAHMAEEIAALHVDVPPIIPRLYLLLPAVVLVYMVMSGQSLRTSALYSTALILVLNIIPMCRVGFKTLYEAFTDGITQSAAIALPTAACGIIIGTVVQSGLANKFSTVVAMVGGSSLFAALVITTFGCILLGMALPTVAAYLIAVVLFVPVMLKLGMPILVAHMFCFYFGVIAQITPPVCLASFTAAGIAGADSWKTGWTAFTYATVAFLVPFAFAYEPALLLQGSLMDTVIASCSLYVGCYGLAVAIAGFRVNVLTTPVRLLFLVSALLCVVPGLVTDAIGITLMAVGFYLSRKQDEPALQAA